MKKKKDADIIIWWIECNPPKLNSFPVIIKFQRRILWSLRHKVRHVNHPETPAGPWASKRIPLWSPRRQTGRQTNHCCDSLLSQPELGRLGGERRSARVCKYVGLVPLWWIGKIDSSLLLLLPLQTLIGFGCSVTTLYRQATLNTAFLMGRFLVSLLSKGHPGPSTCSNARNEINDGWGKW